MSSWIFGELSIMEGEMGKRQRSADTLSELAEALKVSLEEVIAREVE